MKQNLKKSNFPLFCADSKKHIFDKIRRLFYLLTPNSAGITPCPPWPLPRASPFATCHRRYELVVRPLDVPGPLLQMLCESCSENSDRPSISVPSVRGKSGYFMQLGAKSPFWGTYSPIATKIDPGGDLDILRTFDSMTFSRISHTGNVTGPETPKNGYFCVQTLLKHEPFEISKFYARELCAGAQRSCKESFSRFYPSDHEE